MNITISAMVNCPVCEQDVHVILGDGSNNKIEAYCEYYEHEWELNIGVYIEVNENNL